MYVCRSDLKRDTEEVRLIYSGSLFGASMARWNFIFSLDFDTTELALLDNPMAKKHNPITKIYWKPEQRS